MNGVTQTRDHDNTNRITMIDGSGDFVAYDAGGNLPSPLLRQGDAGLRQAGMTVVPQLPLPGYSPGYFLCTYDAWNRLTGVYTDSRSGGGTLGEYDSTDTPVALYEYDGLNRRTTKLVYDDADGDWDRTDYYYDREWRVIEERLERDLSGGAELLPAESVYAEYVWDPHYADAPAARFRDADGYTDDNENGVIDPAEQGDGTREEVLFYVTDANHNVTAVVNGDGKVVERYVYDAYGRPHVVNGDLTVDPDGDTDLQTDADGDGNPANDGLDEWTLDPDNRSDALNEILFAGTRLDTETNFHQVRHRYYHNTLGRWLGPDPKQYVDGLNYYEYCRSGPINGVDPMGTETLETNGKDVWWVIEEPGTLWDSDVRWVWLGTKKGDRVDIKMQFPATWNAPAPKTVSYKALEEYASKYWREHGDIHRLPRTNQDGRILMALRAVASGQTITTPSMWEIAYAAADSGAGAGFHEWLYWMTRPVTWVSGEEIDCVVQWREHYWRKSGLEGSTAQVISRNAAVVSAGALCSAGALKLAAATGVSHVGSVPLSQVPQQFAFELYTMAATGSPLGYKALTKGTDSSSAGILGRAGRFFYDGRNFPTISREYWRTHGPAGGRALHHWLFPRRATWVPEGIRNAGFNLIELPSLHGWFHQTLDLNTWMGFARNWGGEQAMQAITVEWGIRMAIPGSLGGAYYLGSELGEYLSGEDN